MKNLVFKSNQHPKRASINGKEEEFSDDVITVDDSGMLNIAFYNYDTGLWSFHHDHFTKHYDSENNLVHQFTWMYKPKELVCK